MEEYSHPSTIDYCSQRFVCHFICLFFKFPILIQILTTPVVGSFVARFINYYTFSQMFVSIFGPETQPITAELRDFWKLIRAQDGYLLWPNIMQYMAERVENEDRWVDAIRDCPVPLHFIYGPHDPFNPSPQFEQTYRSIVKRPSLHVLPGIGHYPPTEAPTEVFQSYAQFIKKNVFIVK